MGGGGEPPCMAEFTKMREDRDKKGMAAQTAAQSKKATREEMCKLVSALADAEGRWVKYAEAHVQSCGIPPEIVSKLKDGHTHTEQARKNLCAAGPAGPVGASTPIHDALAPPTVTPPAGKGGIFDTMNGSVIR
jgi:hypothetical protein